MIEFVFMLTHHDATVDGAAGVLERLRGSGLRYVGFKDVGQSVPTLTALAEAAHEQELEVMLEVVSTSAADERRSLEAARQIGVDWVLGGTDVETGLELLGDTDVRYCPFPGRVTGHPSVLGGTIQEIADHAAALTDRDGVYGVDLLAFRHNSEDPIALTRAVVDASSGPVIAAGSVASLQQIRDLEGAGAWGFTIGGAIFEDRLPGGPGVPGQVKAVLDAIAAAPKDPVQ
jgi:hypothetical protein